MVSHAIPNINYFTLKKKMTEILPTICPSSIWFPNHSLSSWSSGWSLHRFTPFCLRTRPQKKTLYLILLTLQLPSCIFTFHFKNYWRNFFKQSTVEHMQFDTSWKLCSDCPSLFLYSKSSISFTFWKHVIRLTKISLLKGDPSSFIYDISKLRLVPSVNLSLFYIPESPAKVQY